MCLLGSASIVTNSRASRSALLEAGPLVNLSRARACDSMHAAPLAARHVRSIAGQATDCEAHLLHRSSRK